VPCREHTSEVLRYGTHSNNSTTQPSHPHGSPSPSHVGFKRLKCKKWQEKNVKNLLNMYSCRQGGMLIGKQRGEMMSVCWPRIWIMRILTVELVETDTVCEGNVYTCHERTFTPALSCIDTAVHSPGSRLIRNLRRTALDWLSQRSFSTYKHTQTDRYADRQIQTDRYRQTHRDRYTDRHR